MEVSEEDFEKKSYDLLFIKALGKSNCLKLFPSSINSNR